MSRKRQRNRRSPVRPAPGNSRRAHKQFGSIQTGGAMKSAFLYWSLVCVCLGFWETAHAREVVVPAGTLLQCTLDEPNFSSATVNVGDPFLCYPRTMQQFGQTVFPR